MSDLSVQMILRLVDQVSGPAKGIESELDRLKRAAETLDDLNKGTPSKKWMEMKEVINGARRDVEKLHGEEKAASQSAIDGYRAQAKGADTAYERRLAQLRAERAEQKRAADEAVAARTAQAQKNQVSENESYQRRLAQLQAERAEQKRAADEAVAARRTAARQNQLDENESYQRRLAQLQADRAEQKRAGSNIDVVGALAGGHEAVRLGRDIMAAGSRATDTGISLATQGNSPEELATIQHEAARLSREFRLFSQTTIANMLGDAKSYTGSLEHAIEAMPDLLRLRTMQEGLHGESNEHDFAGLTRSAEIAGATASPEKLHDYFDMVAKIMNVFRETLNPQSFASFYSETSSYGRHLSPRFMMGAGAHLMQELGPGAAGNAIAMWEQALEAGTMTPKAMEQFDKLGLLDQSKVRRKSNGEIRWIDPGGIKGYQLALTDPDLWTQTVLKPALDKLSPEERDAAEQALFSNKSVRTANDKMLNQGQVIDKDRKLVEGAEGLSASDAWSQSPSIASKTVSAQTENIYSRAANPILPWYASAAQGFSSLMARFNAYFDDHPGRATEAAALGVGGAAIGAAKIASAMMGQLGKAFGLGGAETAATVARAGGAKSGSLIGVDGLMNIGIDTRPAWSWAGAGRGALKGLGKGLILGAIEEAGEFGIDQLGSAQRRGVEGSFFNQKFGADEEAKSRAKAELEARANAWKDAGWGDTLWSLFHGKSPWERPGSEGLLKPTQETKAAPVVDGQSIDDAKAKADQAKTALDQLNATVSPAVDVAGLDALIAKAKEAQRQLSLLNAMAPSGSFSPSSGALHDGPEAR